MSREISVRELRNHTADVVAAVRSGERVSLTVNRVPVADIVPHARRRSAWVPSSALREVLQDSAADPELLRDLADVRGELLEEA
ncbi:MAG TPA: type II toxin-antitoxin system prevent-host-death family antitoxin [Solirubrobacteraceae bacterium]|nr:type II toxin-antitoxin system prevent-host-death family antitoxin [Solirubrobacteraceae bacterium]